MAWTVLDFTALDVLTAEQMDQLYANMAGLKDGSLFDAGAIGPEDRSGGFAMGKIDVSTSPIVVTGVGFQPKEIEFQRIQDTTGSVNFARGVSIGTASHKSTATSGNTSNTSTKSSETYSILNILPNQTVNCEGSVTAVGSDGFTVTMNTTLSAEYMWVARG